MDSLVRHDAPAAATHRLPRFQRPRPLLLAAAVTVGLGGLGATFALDRPTAPVALPPPPVLAAPRSAAGVTQPALAQALCSIKESIRWHAAAWSPAMCDEVAAAVIAAAVKHHLSPALILGVMLNESDLDENVVTRYRKAGVVYAQDSGLMGVRCVFDGRGRCGNGIVRGLTPGQTAQFGRNIELGAQILALARDGDGVERRLVRKRLPDGELVTTSHLVRCRHKTHAYWAHYNHGSFYISRGSARHYPQRVGVLYYAVAQSLGLPCDELFTRPLTITDPGRRPRTADHPVEPRFRKLVSKIYQATGLGPHTETALASLAPGR